MGLALGLGLDLKLRPTSKPRRELGSGCGFENTGANAVSKHHDVRARYAACGIPCLRFKFSSISLSSIFTIEYITV